MIVVSDTSPITNLAAIGQVDLLRALYGQVYLPDAVFVELTSDVQQPGAEVTLNADWIFRRKPIQRDLVNALLSELDKGEAEAIALAVELEADLLLIDEQAGRAAATRLGVHRIGLLGVLLEAKSQGLVIAVRPLLDALRDRAGFWLNERLYNHVLKEAGED